MDYTDWPTVRTESYEYPVPRRDSCNRGVGGSPRKTELLLSDKRGMNSGLAKLMTPIP